MLILGYLMPINFSALACNTDIHYSKTPKGVHLQISTPNLEIRSIRPEDMTFYQSLWANKAIMAKFAEGEPRL
jgi:hypothetical protein